MPVQVGAAVNLIDVTRQLEALGKQVSNLRPFFRVIDAELSQLLREQFATRGAALNGTPWRPLSPATVEARIATRMLSKRARSRARRAAGADTPLLDSGGLAASFTKPQGPMSYRDIQPMEYERGSRYNVDGVPVAVLMQTGFMSPFMPVFDRKGDVAFVRRPDGPKAVPARPIIPAQLPAPVIRGWEGQLVTYLETGALH